VRGLWDVVCLLAETLNEFEVDQMPNLGRQTPLGEQKGNGTKKMFTQCKLHYIHKLAPSIQQYYIALIATRCSGKLSEA
jgi:predicted HTH transcriptional regulator